MARFDASGPDSNADTPDDELYAGKYRSVEEMEEAVKGLEQKISEQGDNISSERQRAEQLQNMLSSQITTEGLAPDDQLAMGSLTSSEPRNVFGEDTDMDLLSAQPTEYAATIYQRAKDDAKNEMRQEYQQLQVQQKAETDFFAQYPDLENHKEDIVNIAAKRVQDEYSHLDPEQRADKIAELSRQRISEIRGHGQKESQQRQGRAATRVVTSEGSTTPSGTGRTSDVPEGEATLMTDAEYDQLTKSQLYETLNKEAERKRKKMRTVSV